MKNIRADGVLIAGQWWDCRELFQEVFDEDTHTILLAHKSGAFNRVHNFISIAEEILGCATSEVGLTQRKTISYIIPSTFWTCCQMRRSLFTILLKAGTKYNGDFDETLYKSAYVAGTKLAVERFFGGSTFYNGRLAGWCDQFRGKSLKQVRRLLS